MPIYSDEKPSAFLKFPAFGGFLFTDFSQLLLVTIFTACLSFTHTDLGFYDETSYLTRGLLERKGIFPAFTDGATYSDIYWFLSHVTNEPSVLYYLGRASSAVIVVVAVWLACRILFNSKIAFIAATTMAILPVTYVWPGVSNPASAFLLIAIALIWKSPNYWSLLFATFLVWIAAGSRPEFVFLGCVLLAWCLFEATSTIIRTRRKGLVFLPLAAFFLLVTFVLILTRLHPGPFSGADRSWTAFTQHFALRHASPNSNSWLEAGAISKGYFPTSESIIGAFKENPVEFARHVLQNMVDTPKVFLGSFVRVGSYSDYLSFFTLCILTTFALIATLCLIASCRKLRTSNNVSRFFVKTHTFQLVFTALVVIFSIVPIIVIYPREHYLVFWVCISMLLAAWVLHQGIPHTYLSKTLWKIFVGAFFIAVALCVIKIPQQIISPPALTSLVSSIQEQPDQLNYLATEFGLEIFASKLKPIEYRDAEFSTFSQLLTGRNINALLLTGDFVNGPWKNLPGLKDFVSDPARYGFYQLKPSSPFWMRKPKT